MVIVWGLLRAGVVVISRKAPLGLGLPEDLSPTPDGCGIWVWGEMIYRFS
ncbi:hypothetical protein [Nonomuraea dietziae]